MRRRLRRRTIIIRICSLALPASCRRVARVLPANEASNSGPTLSVGLAVISLRCCAVLCCAVLVASVILFTNRARVLFLARHTKVSALFYRSLAVCFVLCDSEHSDIVIGCQGEFDGLRVNQTTGCS